MEYLESSGRLQERVWVEWRVIGPDISASDREWIVLRIEALSVLGTATAPEFHLPPRRGLIEDVKFNEKNQAAARKTRIRIRMAIDIASRNSLANKPSGDDGY
jgi:hypothetical protein